jgi:succinate dehydrogenase/fumarate reductase flavoprotein subunit
VVAERAAFGAFLERREGAAWKEANYMVQQLMRDYANAEVRSETLLSAGLKYLHDLQRHTLESVACVNSHELMRTAEVMELMDCAEVIFIAALARQETRGTHRRSTTIVLPTRCSRKNISRCGAKRAGPR